jgi:hypothetical protein
MHNTSRRNYIEFRVYLKDGVDAETVADVADDLQDQITDSISEEGAPPVFMQDVTYEVLHTDQYVNHCRCKDTLSTMIDGKPTCAKCGKVQIN